MTKKQTRSDGDREYDRHYYHSKRTAGKQRYYCTLCSKQLRSDSTRNICRTCWRKSDEGREYFRLMKIKSRQNQSKD